MTRISTSSRFGLAVLAVALVLWYTGGTGAVTFRKPQDTPGKNQDLSKTGFARLREITATAVAEGVLIEWRTEFELNNLGFKVYRLQDGQRTQLNPSIIPGSALIVGQGRPLYAGYSYSWLDRQGNFESEYQVEAVDLGGHSAMYEPVTPVSGEERTVGASSRLFSDLGAPPAAQSQASQREWSGSETVSSPPVGIDTIQDQWAIAAQSSLKIGVKSEGWYHLTQSQLAAAGFDTSGDAGNLRLFVGGQELAMLVSRQSGPLSATDYIEFYGLGLDVPTTDTQMYWLVNGSQPGLRISSFGERHIDGGPVSGPTPEVSSCFPTLSGTLFFSFPINGALTCIPAGESLVLTTKASDSGGASEGVPLTAETRRKALVSTAAANFAYTVQRKDRTVYFSSLLNGDTENFFGEVLSGSSPAPQTLTIHHIERTAAGPAQLQVALQGVTQQAHQVNVLFNGVQLGSVSFFALDHAVQTFSVPGSLLAEGNNSVQLVPVAAASPPTTDVDLVDYLQITYPHSYIADSNTLHLSIKFNQSARIDGFTDPNARILDVTNPMAVAQVRPIVETTASGYALTIPAAGQNAKGRRTLVVFPSSELDQPASTTLNQPSTWNQAVNGADLVIISHPTFIPSLAPLISKRQSQGFSVAVVSIDDVYDEFSYGLHTPQAIRDFMLLATTKWAKAPRYLLLVGDSSYDPRDYQQLGSADFVPTKLVDTEFLETASDDWLTDFDNDGIANVATGRLSARTVADANTMVTKIVNFTPSNAPQTAMLVADTQGSYYFDFEQASDQVIPLLPAAMTVQKVYRRLEPSDSAAHTDIINKFNSGLSLVNFSGHGNVNIWTGGSIFSTADALALNNGNRLPLVIVMDCLNGYFIEPRLAGEGIAESLLKAPNGGAVAAFASSGDTIPDGQHEMSQLLYQLLYGSQSIALGDATRQAKGATTDIDVRRTWILFGDPTMKIR
jgi:hypothetical protein